MLRVNQPCPPYVDLKDVVLARREGQRREEAGGIKDEGCKRGLKRQKVRGRGKD